MKFKKDICAFNGQNSVNEGTCQSSLQGFLQQISCPIAV